MTSINIQFDSQAMAAFCRRWKVHRLDLFGSVLRSDFRADSDIDILVEFDAETSISLLDHEAMRLELCHLVGREVDLVSRRAIERSHNLIRRRAILDSTVPLHVA